MGIAGGNCVMALSGIISAISRDTADVLIGWDLARCLVPASGGSDLG